MFNGFPSTNTPAIQVWDFYNAFASSVAIRSVSLADDCAPIQYFRTGGSTTAIRVNLPLSPPDGKIIKIVNHSFGGSIQALNIYFADVSSGSPFYAIGQGQTLDLCYSKFCDNTINGQFATGWLALNQTSLNCNGYNAICFGYSNSATNTHAAVIGGNAQTASGQNSGVFAGTGSTASGQYATVVGGSGNTSGGTSAFVGGGQSNNASNSYTFVGGGFTNAANAFASAVVGGYYGTARSVEGRIVFPASANPITLAAGVAQTSILVVGKETTNATATVLVSNQSAAGSGNQLALPNNGAYHVRGSCIANVTGGGNTKAWTFDAVIKRGANAAATSIVGAVIKNIAAADSGASTWDITVSADTTNGALAVTVTGQAATTIRWVCKLEATEVSF